MKRKKGFIKVIEVILASFLLFFVLIFISQSKEKREEYELSLLAVIGRDALASLDKAGILRNLVLNNDLNALRNEIYKIIPSNARVEIEIIHLNKNVIKIGCNCSYEERERLKRMLAINYPEDALFYFRGKNINLEILDISSLDEMKDANVIAFFGCRDLSNYYNYLDEGKSFLMISTVACENNLFNLTPKIGSAESFIINQNSLESFRIGEYFVDTGINVYNNSIFWVRENSHALNIYLDNNSIPYVTYDNNEFLRYYKGDVMIIDNTRIKIDDIVIDYSTGRAFAEIRIIDRNYEFYFQPSMLVDANEKSILINFNGYAASQLNYYISRYGNGKTAWINDYSEERTDLNQLMKAIIFWLSENIVYKEEKLKNYVTVYYIVSGNYDFEPYMIKMNLWYIY
ncbi:MAG: hypothetical protein QXU71_02415 [Candidatus Aenigmatarchaeota archaeon]